MYLVRKCELNFKRTPQNPVDYNYQPQSSAVGDFNNDTWLDIVVASRAASRITVLLGSGRGTFPNSIDYSTGVYSAPCMVAVSDLNKDRRLDIAVANFGTNSVIIFLGLGNGSFINQAVLSTGRSRPIWIHLADFNSDSLPDMVTADHGTQSVTVYFGHGNGSFAYSSAYSTGYDSFPQSVVSGDLNNDQQLDLVVANYGTNNIGVLLGRRNGTFSNQKISYTGAHSHPRAVTAGHFNRDSFLDIAVANHGSSCIIVLLGHGDGTFSDELKYTIGTASPYAIATADFNRDNQLDIVVTNQGTENIGLLLGYGNGTFKLPRMYSTGSSSTTSVSVGDFNNDNRPDITVINNDTQSIGVLLGYFEGYQDPLTYSTGSDYYTYDVALGDLNNDTILDIVATNTNSASLSVFLGLGDGHFAARTTYSTGAGSNPTFVALGDLNNDATLDIVVVNFGTGTVGIFLGYGNGSFSAQTTLSTGSAYQLYSVALGDLNKDRILDIVVVIAAIKSVGVFLGYGNGSFSHQNTFSTGPGSSPTSLALGDLNSDATIDIVVAAYSSGMVGVLLGLGNGSFAEQTTYSTGEGNTVNSLTLGDVNNDNILDIVVAKSSSKSVGIFLGKGNGMFENQRTQSTSLKSDPAYVALADLNNDTVLDFVVTYVYSNYITIAFGHGDGSSGDQMTYSTGPGSYPTSMALADLNNDTFLDIVIANSGSRNNVLVLLQYNRGTLATEVTFASGSGSHLRSAAVADFDQNGILDIIVASSGTKNVGILLGHGNGSFLRETVYSIGSDSHPQSIAIGSFNNDDYLDIVVANSGSNDTVILLGNSHGTFDLQSTPGFQSIFAPVVVAVADFNHDGQAEILVAFNDTDTLIIRETYTPGSLTEAVTYPISKESYLNSVILGNLNSDNILDIVVADSKMDNVQIFLGQRNGSFSHHGTFSTGDGSHPFCAALGDLNNDSILDIVVANKGYGNMGIVFGNGNGSFSPQRTISTGGYSNDSCVALGDLNKDSILDVVVTNSGSANIGIFIGYGNGSFSHERTYSTGLNSNPFCLALSDLNNDSNLDIVVSNSATETIGIFLGHGNGLFDDQSTYPTGPDTYPFCVVVGDLNNDDLLDIVVTHKYKGSVGAFLGYGNGSFGDQMTYLNQKDYYHPNCIALGDMNNDNILDIVAVDGFTQNVVIFFGYGNGSFGKRPTQSIGIAFNVLSVAVGDFNNDHALDVTVVGAYPGNMAVSFGQVNVVLKERTVLKTGNRSRPQSFAMGDFNHDARMDFCVANAGTDSIGIFLGYGNLSFADQVTYFTGTHSYPYFLDVADLNKDQILDIVVANRGTNDVGVLFGYGNGSFANQITYRTGSNSAPYHIAVADFNNDSSLDIAVANHDSNNLCLLLGHGNGSFADCIFFPLDRNSRPFSILVGDYNGDHRQDLAVANEGSDSLTMLLQTC